MRTTSANSRFYARWCKRGSERPRQLVNNSNRRLQVIFSAIGLLCVAISLALNFVAPGTFWSWALLLVAFGFLLLSRRYR